MESKYVLCFLIKIFFIFNYTAVLIHGASSTIGEHIKFTTFQSQSTANPQPQLSSAQQQQILNDVQQHQRHYSLADASRLVTFPGQTHISLQSDSTTTSFPSLAKYKVDRTKQNHRQLDASFLQTAHTQHQISRRPIFTTTPTINSFNTFGDLPSTNFQNPQNINFYNEQANLNLQAFYEKQRELELLRKQKEQLILEQQELRRQQELLRLEKLASATSTTSAATTTTIVSSTTLKPTTPSIITVSPTIPRITPAESDIFLKAIATHQKKFTSTSKPQTTNPTTLQTLKEITVNQTQDIPLDLLSLIQAQNPHLLENDRKSKIKIIYQAEKPLQTSDKFLSNSKNKSLEKDKLLRNLKLALAASSSSDDSEKNVTTRDLILPNGRKLQVIQAPNGLSSIIPNEGSSQFQTVTQALDSTASVTTVKPVEAILKELTEGVVPRNTEFEVLRQKDGKLEQVGQMPINNPLGKKVTFVVLEEQADGSYKVQGIKGNSDNDSNTEVESIVEKIKKGEIQLPPNSKRSNPKITTKYPTVKPTVRPTTIKYSKIENSTKLNSTLSSTNYVTTRPNIIRTDDYEASSSTPVANFFNSVSPFDSNTGSDKGSSVFIQPHQNRFISSTTPSSITESFRPTSIQSQFFTTPRQSSSYTHFTTNSGISITPSTSIRPTTISTINSAASENLIIDDLHNHKTSESSDPIITHQATSTADTIASIFRREGLFAMAKYLRQSGLDTVLNETGPYTIFVPTDKAFRALLVQLGGPEKAELKFRENPRLLSGLLLHHVIPGAFRMDSLQEEMTGVSLAGTQLRVNIYDMHDHEWNDVKVTTINGAKILSNKRDIEIPQGIAHTMDRVMFPLPVGDLMQTLAADREQRFKTFLKILHASGMDETLSGTKTFTIFAPTDEALVSAAVQTGRPVWTEADSPEVAKTIASKYIIPTTLYTAGMRFYLQKDTLRPQFSVKIQKNGGKIRVNDAHVVTYNVPATNGVIHSIDNVL